MNAKKRLVNMLNKSDFRFPTGQYYQIDIHRQIDIQVDRYIGRYIYRQIYIQVDIYIGRQIYVCIGRQIYRQIDKQVDKYIQIDRNID